MATTQTFETIVKLNAQQAKNEMAALQKTIDDLKKKKADALSIPSTSVKDINKINKEIKAAEAALKAYSSSVAKTIDTINNVETASLGEIEKAAREVRKAMKQVATPEDYESLNVLLVKLQARTDSLRKASHSTIEQYSRDIGQAQERMRDFSKENQLIEATLKNISGSSLRDLETSLKLVNEQLKDTNHGTKEFQELTDKAKRLKAEIAAINREQELSKGKWAKWVDFFNVNWGFITQAIGALTGLSMTIRKCSADFALMDEQMTDVIKYTGLTKRQVEQLNETFKQMDTRTPRGKLNQLAGDAGRLGITSQEAVREFVDAADKINVALGDDLGDDAVKNIGKLAQMFGDDKTKGLRGAMLATGSVVNELAQSSSASAGYLVDFTARLAGVAKQAGLTQQQIMGFASVLDQNMQQDEAAATAMQNLIAKMFQEPAKFAALAGKSVKEFSTLLKTDANEALLQFFGAMRSQGGFEKLAPMFDKMGMDGSRCVAVFSVMADKLADVKTAQDIANRAYADGSSVVNEFNTQMTSAQAQLDMAKKRFKDLSIELGNVGSPVAYVDPKEQKKTEAAARKREREMKAATKAAYQAEIKAAKDKTDREQADNIMAYSVGKKTYTEYLDAQHDIALRGYEALKAVYKKYGTEYGQWEEKIAAERQKREEDHSKALLSDIEQRRQSEIDAANADFYNKNSDIYQDEEALNERLFEIDMSALADRMAALKEGSEEWLDTRAEMTQRENERQLYLQQHYAELLSRYRADWASKDVAEQEWVTLRGLDLLHEKGLLKEEEYQKMLKNVRLHYAEQQAQQSLSDSAGEQLKRNAHSAFSTASANAKASASNKAANGVGITALVTSDVDIYKSTLANIKSMEQEGLVSHQEAMAAMSEATATMCNGLVSKMQAAMDAVSPLMSAMSSYYSAQSDYEVTVTEKKYEKLISAAGNNTAKTQKLEEKKEKEVARIKSKYARKQAAMQIAQAIAQTAISAIAAYSSAMQGVPYPTNMVLAPIAAGIATAAGLLQVATIKKQQKAQEAGYYEGGFTGGTSYRRRAGVVHEGEFVANHKAVGNANILPALQLIDEAQRNNTVSSLTAADISRSLGQGSPTVVSAPTVTVTTDNSALNDTLAEARDVIDRLSLILADGIHADVYIDGPNGIAHNLNRFNQLKSRT